MFLMYFAVASDLWNVPCVTAYYQRMYFSYWWEHPRSWKYEVKFWGTDLYYYDVFSFLLEGKIGGDSGKVGEGIWDRNKNQAYRQGDSETEGCYPWQREKKTCFFTFSKIQIRELW